MTFNNDWKKLLIAEIKAGKQLQDKIWNVIAPIFTIGATNKNIYFADEADSLVVDGQMELWNSATDLTNWSEQLGGTSTVNREGADVHRGTYSVRFDIDASNNLALVYQNITLVAGNECLLSVWYKTAAGKTAFLRLAHAPTWSYWQVEHGAWDGNGIILPTATVWTNYTLKFIAHVSYANYEIMVGHYNTGGSSAASSSIYMDDVFICPKLTATLAEADYNSTDLCTEIKSKMEVPGAGVYTISYSAITNLFTFASTTLLYLYLTTVVNDLWPTVGFSTAADSNFAVSHTGTIPTPLTYYCTFGYGEVVDLQIDGVSLTRKTTLVLCEATVNSYYHDFFNGILYANYADSPGTYVSPDYTYNVVAYIWKCFANRQEVGALAIVFIPTGCTYPVLYDPVLRADSLSQLTATVADHFESAMETSSGGISLTNADGWWYGAIDDYYWNNADIRAKIGQIGDAYAALETIFIGKVRTPAVMDDAVTFEMVDSRQGRLQSIPVSHFNLTDYPNLPDDALGEPIPILFGQKTNISPVRISTAAYTFKISQTHFGANVFELSTIDAVYYKGMALSLATHYTVDLHNGELTLTFDPGDGLVTCDAKGIEDGFNMATGVATGAYSENVADHLFFVLHILNEIPVADINLTSFADLQTARTQKVAWFLDTDIPTIDFNRLLQQTSLYHFLPLNNGTFAAKYYRKTVPAGTLELRNYDHAGYKKYKPSDGIFRDITLKYDKDPTTGIWQILQNTEDTVEQNHGTKEPYTIETALRDATEAASVMAFYVTLLRTPPTKIDTSMSMIGSAILPTDKLRNNRDVVIDGKAVTISTDEIYVILQTRKDLGNGRVGVTAQLDTQLAIYTTHADSPHQDIPHADHSDVIHTDASHSDHTDSVPHGDTPHVDREYLDSTYTDYDDVAHGDNPPHYGDEPPYTDSQYNDWPHQDHSDNIHVDCPYWDEHTDDPYIDYPHEDGSHSDHTDTIHTDSHTDISHIDSEV